MNTRELSQEELTREGRFMKASYTYKIDGKTVIKTGPCTRMAEAEALKLVRDRTTISVPEVYDVYTDEKSGMLRIVMEYIKGDTLRYAWDDFTPEDKESVISQLRGFVEQLREIKGSFIGSVDGSRCLEHCFEKADDTSGPFADESKFNEGIIKALKRMKSLTNEHLKLAEDLFRMFMTGHETVLTYNDLDGINILVRGSKVVALLDWDRCGYYPDYWEYCTAMRWSNYGRETWDRERAYMNIFKPHMYERELSVLRLVPEVMGNA
ncbi:kinase-like domain-containing protein [Lasiosphaeris hirsuta]|uniref:Kinase-like domain-containing protein n=1 Tax=Lasiosphaeris hirsuta TaxID=260670 RepID=A0AA40DWT2_9PEZI|nr:kinase-like domain-containing protein [Lasiosphaeris hirsuta]